MRWLKFLGIAALCLVLLAAGGLVYLSTADLSRYKHAVERAISEASGRTLTIAGRFEPEIGLNPSLVATEISYAGADWSEEPVMVQAGHLAVSINLWSLIWRPIVVNNLELRDARIRLEVDEQGRSNWELGPGAETDRKQRRAKGVEVVFQNVDAGDVEISYRDRSADRKLTVTIDQLSEHPDGKGLLAVEGRGRFNQKPWELAGYIGPMSNLLAGEDVRHRLSGRIGTLQLDLQGRTGELATLSDPDLRFELRADDMSVLADLVDLGRMREEPLRARGRVSPLPDGVAMAFDLELGAMRASANGSADKLLDSETLELTVAASGPESTPLSAFVKGIPEGAFAVKGRLRKQDSSYFFEAVETRLGENHARVNGRLGELPHLAGTRIEFETSGPDLSAFSRLAGIPLAAEPFRAEGRLDWESGALKLGGVSGRVGENRLALDGVLGPPPKLAGTDLQIRARGPDFSAIPLVAAYADAPPEAFEVKGRLRIGKARYEIEGIRATLGGLNLRADGVVGLPPKLTGTDVRIEADGADLSRLRPYTRVEDLPAAPYSLRGRVRSRESRYLLESVLARIGAAEIKLEGELAASSDLIGTAIEYQASVPDPALFEPVVGGTRLPTLPFISTGRVRITEAGYELVETKAQLGDAIARVEGTVARAPDLIGTDLKFDVAAPDVTVLAVDSEAMTLPREPFSTKGTLRVTVNGYELRNTTTRLGKARVALSGTVGRPPDFSSTELSFDASAPDLSLLAPFAGDLELPEQPFSSSGRLTVSEKGYVLSDTTASIGDATLRIDGTVGTPPKLIDTNISFTSEGPDLSAIASIMGLAAPAEAFRISGRAERLSQGLRLHEASATVGEHQLEVNGLLGEPPALAGTELDFRAKGPDLEMVSRLAGLYRSLSEDPFEISARIEGSPEVFSLRRLNARLGESDLSGSLDLDLRNKPDLKGELSFRLLDLETLLAEAQSEAVTDQPGGQTIAATPDPPAGSKPAGKPQRLIPDTPLNLEALHAANADIRFSGGKIRFSAARFSNLEFHLRLANGSLELDPISARDEVGGSLSATATLAPEDGGYRVAVNGSSEKLRLGLLSGKGEDPANQPPLDWVVSFESRGSSPREMAVNGNGRIELIQGTGRIAHSAANLLVRDLTLEILNALNPFRREAPYTTLECGVFGVRIVDGVATLDPVAARTDRMTLVGSGRIDLKTERINLTWSSRPRKGLGVSASAITNRVVQLGGTLSSPALNLNPTGAALSTGAAVATGGLSLIAEGLLDRLRAEQDVCKAAREQLRGAPRKPTLIEKLLP